MEEELPRQKRRIRGYVGMMLAAEEGKETFITRKWELGNLLREEYKHLKVKVTTA